MAKILAPYSLCPLVEHKHFLGMADDASSDCVIVTFSKNMVIRYRLSDQKELSSWTTKHKLSAPVVYDFFNKNFIGVYNSEVIALWQNSMEQMDKPKTYKFTCLIYGLVSSREVPPQIVYMNGSIAPLNVGRESRREPSEDYISTSENIEDAKLVSIHGNNYVSILTQSKSSGNKTLYFNPISDGKEKIVLKLIHRDPSIKFVCHTVLVSETSSALLTLWSNGDLNILELPPGEETEQLPGRLVGQAGFIRPTERPALFPVTRDQVAILGVLSSGEGATIAIYSVKFGVVEASEKLKVYNKVEKALGRYRELIILSGESLLVVPFKLGSARLAVLIGSQAEGGELLTGGDLEELSKQGLPESRICATLLPQHLKEGNVEEILKVLEKCTDIPDEILLSTLGFALKTDEATGGEGDGKSGETRGAAIIESVLSKQLLGDGRTLSWLRQHVTLSGALRLLRILTDEVLTKPVSKVALDWACLLLDAHYQEYLLSREPQVGRTLATAFETISEALEYMEELKRLDWAMTDFLRGRTQLSKPPLTSRDYIIETVNLY